MQARDCIFRTQEGTDFRHENLGVEYPERQLVSPPRIEVQIFFVFYGTAKHRSSQEREWTPQPSVPTVCNVVSCMEIRMDTIKFEWGKSLKITVQGRVAIGAILFTLLLCISLFSQEIRSSGAMILHGFGKTISAQRLSR